jgi:hypothetical protein
MRRPTRSTARATKSRTAAPDDVTPSRARHAAAVLGKATPRQVQNALALDQQLAWYFEYGENALRRENVAFLPSYAVAGAFGSKASEDAIRVQAHALARTVEARLHAIVVLRAAYTPRRWPKNVESAFETLAPVVVRLEVANNPWPARSAHAGLEEAAAARLSAGLASGRAMKVDRLKADARRLFGAAVAAYAEARAASTDS